VDGKKIRSTREEGHWETESSGDRDRSRRRERSANEGRRCIRGFAEKNETCYHMCQPEAGNGRTRLERKTGTRRRVEEA